MKTHVSFVLYNGPPYRLWMIAFNVKYFGEFVFVFFFVIFSKCHFSSILCHATVHQWRKIGQREIYFSFSCAPMPCLKSDVWAKLSVKYFSFNDNICKFTPLKFMFVNDHCYIASHRCCMFPSIKTPIRHFLWEALKILPNNIKKDSVISYSSDWLPKSMQIWLLNHASRSNLFKVIWPFMLMCHFACSTTKCHIKHLDKPETLVFCSYRVACPLKGDWQGCQLQS